MTEAQIYQYNIDRYATQLQEPATAEGKLLFSLWEASMDISRYKIFLRILEAGSLTAAAEESGYSPSGITRMMDSLEKETGFPLLSRSSHGVRLTKEGEALLPSIRDMVKAEEKVKSLQDSLLSLTRGDLYIGSYFSIAAHWLPSILSLYHRKYPLVQIHLKECGNRECLEGMAEGTLSCAFMSRRPHLHLHWIPLKEDRLLAWIPQSHPLAAREAILPSDLENIPFINILPHEDTDIEDFLRRHRLHPRFTLSTASNYTAWRMVEAGLGISLNNELMSEGWKGRVQVRPFTTGDSVSLGLAVPEAAVHSPALRKWIEVTLQWMGRK